MAQILLGFAAEYLSHFHLCCAAKQSNWRIWRKKYQKTNSGFVEDILKDSIMEDLNDKVAQIIIHMTSIIPN
jgi:hypothetical protein